MTRREISYTWRIREVMARRHVHNAKDLTQLLNDRGVTLTANAVWRIVTQNPERISFQVLAALCDALDVTPNDLITITATDTKTIRQRRKAAGDTLPDLRDYRPVRARIVSDDD